MSKLSNHLGNVLSVISDIKTPVASGMVVSYYESVVISSQDYSPFGVTLEGRSWSAGYRYGFQNQETDDEMWGGAISFKYRVEDARLGRFFSVDPLFSEYPWNSPFAFAENDVIVNEELEGLEKKPNRGGAYPCPWFESEHKKARPQLRIENWIKVKTIVEVKTVQSMSISVNGRVDRNLSRNIKARAGISYQFVTYQVADQLQITRNGNVIINTEMVATDADRDGNNEVTVSGTINGGGKYNIQVTAGPLPPGFEDTVYDVVVNLNEQKIVTTKRYSLFGIFPIKINRSVEYRDLSTKKQLKPGRTEEVDWQRGGEDKRKARKSESRAFKRLSKQNKSGTKLTG